MIKKVNSNDKKVYIGSTQSLFLFFSNRITLIVSLIKYIDTELVYLITCGNFKNDLCTDSYI